MNGMYNVPNAALRHSRSDLIIEIRCIFIVLKRTSHENNVVVSLIYASLASSLGFSSEVGNIRTLQKSPEKLRLIFAYY